MVGGVMDGNHIHTPDDGRGMRRVHLNGVALERVVYADTERGIARVYDNPPKLDKWGKRIIERTKRGVVTVEPIAP
ncbi:MAG: hypothetical protein DI565_20585 [Ancylobacter novellus]|nr:MAG: hypothetical protein DI565_20585 [Ancylobacter novellus]